MSCASGMTETVIVRSPGGVILQQLQQVGSSIGQYNANTVARKSTIQSLQKQLDECGSCSSRAQIAGDLEYWKGLDTTVNNITSSVMQTMGYGQNADLRNFSDPNFKEREAAKYEARERLRVQTYTYCRDVLKKQDQEFSTCITENNENYLNTMDDVVRPLCNQYVTAVTGVATPIKYPEPENMSDPEAVRQFQIKRNVYREVVAKIDECSRQFNPIDIIRDRVKYVSTASSRPATDGPNKEIVDRYQKEVFEYCLLKGVDYFQTHPSELLAAGQMAKQLEMNRDCQRQNNATDLASNYLEARKKCHAEAKARNGIGNIDSETKLPPQFYTDFNQCVTQQDPFAQQRKDVAIWKPKYKQITGMR
jgi:hypothetical protein